jgi:hypothetical protein
MLACLKIYNRRHTHKNYKETVDEKNNFGIPINLSADVLFWPGLNLTSIKHAIIFF